MEGDVVVQVLSFSIEDGVWNKGAELIIIFDD